MNEKNIEKGINAYNRFINKIYPYGGIDTPHMKSLELFGFLKNKNKKKQLIAEMCRELITNFESGYFVEDNILKQQVKTSITIKELKE